MTQNNNRNNYLDTEILVSQNPCNKKTSLLAFDKICKSNKVVIQTGVSFYMHRETTVKCSLTRL